MTRIDPELKKWATALLSKRIDAVNRIGSVAEASRELPFNERAFYRDVAVIKQKAAKQGYSPDHGMTNTVPAPFTIKGLSTYTKNAAGEPVWVKATIDQEKLEELHRAAIDAFNSKLKREPAVPAPSKLSTDLLNLYVITDYHFGMMAWAEESGADWDMEIAEELLVKWFAQAIKNSPATEVGVFAQLGDFLHFDGMTPVTVAHHNVLDADVRFQQLVRVVIRVIRRIIKMMLQKHKMVHVLMAEGNHDPASSIWLREWLSAFYDEEPRVTVDVNPDPYYCYEHGDTSLFFHHGHKKKVQVIDDVFVAKFREIFGRTKQSYAHMGHLHSIDIKETKLMIVEQHRTMASADAYSTRGGWVSGRDSKCITYHKKYGEVGRITINPEMVYDNNSV